MFIHSQKIAAEIDMLLIFWRNQSFRHSSKCSASWQLLIITCQQEITLPQPAPVWLVSKLAIAARGGTTCTPGTACHSCRVHCLCNVEYLRFSSHAPFFFFNTLLIIANKERSDSEAGKFKSKKKGIIFSTHMELKCGRSNDVPYTTAISESQ